MNYLVHAAGAGSVAGEVTGWIFALFLLVVLGAILVRVFLAVVRRKRHGIRDVFEPFVQTGRIQSELYGVRTYGDEDLAPGNDPPAHDRP